MENRDQSRYFFLTAIYFYLFLIPPIACLRIIKLEWWDLVKDNIWMGLFGIWISLFLTYLPSSVRYFSRNAFLLIIFILDIIYLIHLGIYGSLPDRNVFLSIFNTHVPEALEFLDLGIYGPWKTATMFFLVPIICVIFVKNKLANYRFLISKKISRSIILCTLSSFCIISYFYEVVAAVEDRTSLTPILFIIEYFQTKNMYKNLDSSEIQGYFVNIKKNNISEHETYILILGESTARNRLQIYGYSRENTPYLQKNLEDLLVFKDVISPHCHTNTSIKSSLTFYKGQEPEIFVRHPSILDLMKKGGFKTFWISNQVAFGRWNTPVGTIAMGTDVPQFLNPEQFKFRTISYDEVLLPPLQNALSDPAKKKFIVLHLRGTHAAYSDRYPHKFEKFTEYSSNKEKIINHYDNAVLYTDFIVGEVIKQVKEKESYSAVMFLSDHGEEVLDYGDFFGHNESRPTPPMFEVPFVLWTSSIYKDKNSFLIKNAKENLSKPYNTKYLTHTLQDMVGIYSQDYDPTLSILNRDFKPVLHRKIGKLDYASF